MQLLLWRRLCFFSTIIPLIAAEDYGFCLQQTKSLPVATDPTWQRGIKRMPSRIPVLAAHDWPLSQKAEQKQLTTNYTPCHIDAPIYRYKVVKGVVYVDHEHSMDARYRLYRNSFLEMLVLSLWLYEDFPDIDLVVDYSDHPQLCHQAIPFLRFSVFNSSLLNPAAEVYNITELLSPSWISQEYVNKLLDAATADQAPSQAAKQLSLLPYTRGFTIPSPEAWQHMSMTQQQMQDYVKCLDDTHPWDSKRPIIFWRGAATGCSRGWPRHHFFHGTGVASARAATPATMPHILRNKRVQLAMRVFPFPDVFDVGLTSIPRITPECLGGAILQAGRSLLQLEHPNNNAAMNAYMHHNSTVRQRQWPCFWRFWPLVQSLVRQYSSHLLKQQQDNSSLQQPHHQPCSPRIPVLQRQTSQRHKRSLLMLRLKRRKRTTRVAGGQQDVRDPNQAISSGSNSSMDNSHLDALMSARAYRIIGSMLNKGEAIGMEGWADAAVTLSIDGYGPAYRLPQQLLLGSAVLKMASPYQTWLDWDLLPGLHYAEFAYDLSDVEKQGFQMLLGIQLQSPASKSATGVNSASQVDTAPAAHHGATHSKARSMADAARSVLVEKLDILAQLDAFAWSVARYKEACDWEVKQPPSDDATWHVLQLDPLEIFMSRGVSEAVQLKAMLHLRHNFMVALRNPVYASQVRAAETAGDL